MALPKLPKWPKGLKAQVTAAENLAERRKEIAARKKEIAAARAKLEQLKKRH